MAERVSIIEVGPRDGLQNEESVVSFSSKRRFIGDLAAAGVRDMEVGAFVRGDRVPQMKHTEKLFQSFDSSLKRVRKWALVPNEKGLERALKFGVRQIALFTAATDGFTQKNIGMSVRESLRVFRSVIAAARENGLQVRGYVSTAFGCPYEGKVRPSKTLRVIEKLMEFGLDGVSIGDTIGVADPRSIEAVVRPALSLLGVEKTSIHLHDTRGTALANALRSYDLGVRTFESSAGGLGGCPYAPGASGNLATEDLVYLFHKMGVRTGLDLDRICRASLQLRKTTSLSNRPMTSRYLQAWVKRSRVAKKAGW